MEQLFLGIDCSTQGLSAVLIDYRLKKVIYEKTINFDKDLSHYNTTHGALSNNDPLLKHSPPLMWVEALDILFQQMKNDNVELKKILAIAGSAQQHGSVYLNKKGISQIASLDPRYSLAENLQGGFSRKTSPIWMDTSTSVECQEIQNAMGGKHAVLEVTGSLAFERFTGPQIRKFFKDNTKGYQETAQIALISSFIASLISGTLAPIDHADGSGMNLMDIQKRQWHQEALNAIAPNLAVRLPSLAESWKVIGQISPFFVQKYGFNKEALALVWSGDNPNSLIGLGVNEDGIAAISLGTSFTYFGYLKQCRIDPSGEGHVFVSPTGDYMSLNCFKNGALAIEKLREMYLLSWEGFDQALMKAPPGNLGRIMLPYFDPEIVPRVQNAGVQRFGLSVDDVSGNCRALIEAQMMSMKIHSRWMNIKPKCIYATGGASVNNSILQIMADVFNCSVVKLEVSKSAALGAACRAVHGYLKHLGEDSNWKEITSSFVSPYMCAPINPIHANVAIYEDLIVKYAQMEALFLVDNG